jgi:ERCC4-type nuclease
MELRVIVDSRERNGELIDALGRAGVSISTAAMPVGDYAISDRVCIERKTVRDFESSLISSRLFEQAERLKQHYESPIIIIEGGADEFRLSRNVIMGAMAHLYIDLGIQVMLSNDADDTARTIALLARHEQHPKKREPSMKGSARAYTLMQYQEYVVGNLPGVGFKTAQALLRKFGSIRSIANAGVKELMEVDNIGKKKADRIYKTMNSGYH